MYIPPSQSPNIRRITFRHPHHQVFSLIRLLLRPALPQPTYYHIPLRQSSAFGFTATSARLPHASHRHLHPATHIVHNPYSLRYYRHGGPRPNLNSQYLGRPRHVRFPLSVASSARRPCRAAYCAPTHIVVPVPSSRHDRSAASSSLSSQVFGSSAVRRRKSMTMGSMSRPSNGAPGRTQTAIPLSRFRHQVNVHITTRFSSASLEYHLINNTQSLSKTALLSRALCRWHEHLLSDK
jgi:hypothetical protein